MRQFVRLAIPTPCHEDWDKMLPAEQGRHCESCRKTVVDFTGMTDQEVFNFFKQMASREGDGGAVGSGGMGSSGHVCGRFMRGQLGREMMPSPAQRNGWSGWKWMVAGSLLLSNPPGGERVRPPLLGATMNRPVDPRGLPASKTLYEAPRVVGDTILLQESPMTGDVDVVRPVGTVPERIVKGKPEATRTAKVSLRTDDSITEMPEAMVTAKPVVKRCVDNIMSGEVVVVEPRIVERIPPDTPSPIRRVVNTTVNILKDTGVALMPASWRDAAVVIYPNPVTSGGQVRLAWKDAPGTRQVMLVSVNGQVVQQRMIEVAGKGQVDEWALPAGLAAGLYFVRVMQPGKAGQTTELLVQ